MAYLKFNKDELVNLEYSLKREVLATNRAGGYMSSTIIGCNTRKYHGLLILPIEEFDGENHVLLSNLDETVIQHGREDVYKRQEWIHTLFFGSGIGHSILLVAIVIFIGIYLGKVKIAGVSLGITWILFVGIIFSHWGMRMDAHALHFLKAVSYTHLDVYKRQG